ncbi:hypothetical protein F4806DRAFT_507510 [Annulohypoxylon nitens]|nr:hypothetical protein F4806DRAFT_507510 [Annulohypoxylon nitens]
MVDQEILFLDQLPPFFPKPFQPDLDLSPPSKGIYDGDDDDLFVSIINVSADHVKSELEEDISVDPFTEAPLTSPMFDESSFCLPEAKILELFKEYWLPNTKAPTPAGPINLSSVDLSRPARQRLPPKRKLHDFPNPLPKSTRWCHEVGVRLTRAYLKSNENMETRTYAWKRTSIGGKGWVRTIDLARSEEVDGEYLLSYACDELLIECRINGDSLPFTLRWNSKANRFESQDDIDGRKIQINANSIIDMMCGDQEVCVSFTV